MRFHHRPRRLLKTALLRLAALQVLSSRGADWVRVFNPGNEETGFVPAAYVKLEATPAQTGGCRSGVQLATVLHDFR